MLWAQVKQTIPRKKVEWRKGSYRQQPCVCAGKRHWSKNTQTLNHTNTFWEITKINNVKRVFLLLSVLLLLFFFCSPYIARLILTKFPSYCFIIPMFYLCCFRTTTKWRALFNVSVMRCFRTVVLRLPMGNHMQLMW